MKLRFHPLTLGVALTFALGASGCAHRTAEEAPQPPAPPPVATAAPVETPPPVIETPPPPPAPPDVDPAFFAFDSYRLGEAARQTLDEAARVLRERPDLQVTIEGHCDERGTVEYNMALGEHRANAARDYLIAAGVAAERIQIISYGEEHPFDMGHDEAAWAQNRRDQFVVRQADLSGSQTSDASE